jgi:hypothetical protein
VKVRVLSSAPTKSSNNDAGESRPPVLGAAQAPPQHQRVLSVGFFGLLLLIAGLIGWDLRRSGGWFNGATWIDGPVWSQTAIGAAMLLLAGFWARRLPPRRVSAR